MNTSHRVRLNKSDLEQAKEFVKTRSGSQGFYESRGGFKEEDILAGALGELAAARFLRRRGFRVPDPDFSLHTTKSFSADLSDGRRHYHVKTQTLESKERYGESWIMQREDPLLRTAPYCHYMVFVVIDLKTLQAEIRGVVSINTIVSYDLIGECRSEFFRRTKVAIYMDALKEMSRKVLWGATWKKSRSIRTRSE